MGGVVSISRQRGEDRRGSQQGATHQAVTGDTGAAQLFADVSAALAEAEGVEPTAAKAVELAHQRLGWDAASVLLAQQRSALRALAHAGDLLQAADELQIETGDGPCVAALNNERPDILAVEGADAASWQRWRAEVRIAGVRDVVVAPLRTRDSCLGVLEVCSAHTAVDDENLHRLETYARHVALAIDNAERHEDLLQAIESRSVIGQAQGKLMERHGLAPDEAQDVLLRCAEETDTDVREVAEALLKD